MTISYVEQGVVFDAGENRLVGIATTPESHGDTGVLVLVGGPQYRVGSHRQFILLARSLAEAGIPSLRFDFSGMGDSEGERLEFDETLGDIAAAIDAFQRLVPGIGRIVLWGLCDAASSALIYAHRDSRVCGVVLLNPWVHSGEYSPEVKLAQLYRPFLSSEDKWRFLVSGRNRILPALKEAGKDTLALVERRSSHGSHASSNQAYVRRMLEGIQQFDRPILIVLSEDDLTANEFSALVASDRKWEEATRRPAVSLTTVPGADHTFSRKAWKDEVSRLTLDWVRDIAGAGQPVSPPPGHSAPASTVRKQ